MKVLLINGSPHAKGCTYTALSEVADTLNNCGIETEIYHVGTHPIIGCTGCGYCHSTGNGVCVYNDDGVNLAREKAKEADGFIFGSPVHYAAGSGAITSFLDRLFYANKSVFEYKPGAVVVSCRRGGATATFDQLNKYLTISNMPVVPSQYWNMVHGSSPDDVKKDLEGLQTMRTLGKNMAWLLNCIKLGYDNGINTPDKEPLIRTNFIR